MGREWYNKAWEEYRKRYGLIFEFTTPYAHQQNGTAERSLRTILDGARTAMAESGLPTKYWADAVQTTVYVRNLVPSSRRPHAIPAELWHGKRQDVSHLRPFGTTAYSHIPVDLNISKLYPRSVKTVLLGYFGRDGYKLLDRETGLTFRSRDIIFEEGITHFTTQPTHTDTTNEDPFPITETISRQAEPKQESTKTDPKPQTDANVPQQMIAPRPLPMTELHKETHDLRSNDPSLTTDPGPGEDTPLTIRRTCRDPRPTS